MAISITGCGERAGPGPRAEPRNDLDVFTRLVRDEPVAAEVEGTPIYVSDVQREALVQGLIGAGEPLDVNAPLFVEVLDQLIDDRLLAIEGVRRGVMDDPETQRRLAVAEEEIYGTMLVERVVSDTVVEEAIRRMYDEQMRLITLGEEIRARHILVASEAEAEEVLAALNDGRSFEELAFERSLDETTKYSGGDLGFFTSDMLVEELAPLSRAAFSTPPGRLAPTIATDLGWHVLRVDDRREERAPTYEELRPQIVRFMTLEEIQSLISVLRARSDVRRYDTPRPSSTARSGNTGTQAPPLRIEDQSSDAAAPDAAADTGQVTDGAGE